MSRSNDELAAAIADAARLTAEDAALAQGDTAPRAATTKPDRGDR
jgi:hypothetical protein